MNLSKQSSRERILSAVRLQLPDRVPVCPRGVQPLARVYGDGGGWPRWQDMIRASEDIGFDCVINWGPADKYQADVKTTEAFVENEDGSAVRETVYETPKGALLRKSLKTEGMVAGVGPSSLSSAMVDGGMVQDEKDLEALESLFAPVEMADVEPFRTREQEMGDHGIVQAEIINPVNMAVRDIGVENLMLLYKDNPEFAKRILAVYQKVALRQTEVFLDAGAQVIYSDGVWCTADLWSPGHMDDLIAPLIKEQTSLIHDSGAYFHLFMDGNCMAALERVADMGVDILSPFETPPSADSDVTEAKKRIGDRVCIWGGVNAYWDVMRGSTEHVREAVREAIQAGSPGGGYVLSTADSIYEPCPLENVYEFFAAAREYGNYNR